MFKSVLGKISRTGRKLSELTGAELQERLDLIKATMLVKALGDNLYKEDRKKEDFDNLADTVIAMPVGEMEKSIQEYLETQMDTYLENIQGSFKELDAKELAKQVSYSGAVNSYTNSLYKSMHWALSCSPSSIEGAGNGVFLKGHVRPGTFLTVIPGTVYLRQHIVDPQYFQPLTKVKSDYKYWNYDGLIIDSTNYFPRTPIALGHIINHPSSPNKPDLKPNVMVIPYEFSKSQGQRYSSIIPNHYIAPEKFMYKVANNHVLPNSYMRSLGIISISEIEDEELFLDYRLPPKAQPAWYRQIDDCTLRRWNLPVEADKDLHVDSYTSTFLWVYFIYIVWKRKHIQSIEETNPEALFTDDMSTFEKAAAFISSGKCRLSDVAKLALYGLYKQATVGNNETPSPSAMDVVGSAKWKSWMSYKDLSKEAAEEKYVDFVTKLVPQWIEAENHDTMETTEGNIKSSEGGFGMKVSKMIIEPEDENDVSDTIFNHCADGETDVVLQYIREHPDKINDTDENGRSLLHWACDRGDLTVVKELMERKADYSKKDDDDFLPLDYACVCEHYDIIDCLKEHGAKLEDCQKESLEFLKLSVCWSMNKRL